MVRRGRVLDCGHAESALNSGGPDDGPVELERAALNLGASALGSFRAVTLPLSLPGVYAGMVMVFILSLGFYVTPALVGGPRNLTIAT
jgi:mannopine transport system permease protein